VSCLSKSYNVMSGPFVFIVIQSYMFVIVFDDSACFCDTTLYIYCDTILYVCFCDITLYIYCDTILYVCFLCLFQHASDEENQVLQYLEERYQKRRQIVLIDAIFGMYHFKTHMNKSKYRVPTKSGYDWVMKNLGHSTSCYNMFRLNKHVFDRLHNVLVESYGLKGTKRMSSVEA
jgi:hypothetical protein